MKGTSDHGRSHHRFARKQVFWKTIHRTSKVCEISLLRLLLVSLWFSPQLSHAASACYLCSSAPLNDPCHELCSDILVRRGDGTVAEEKVSPGNDHFKEDEHGGLGVGSLSPRSVWSPLTHCNPDLSGGTEDCIGSAANSADSGVSNLEHLFISPGDRSSGITANSVTSGTSAAADAEVFSAQLDTTLASQHFLKLAAYALTEPSIATSLDRTVVNGHAAVQSQTLAENNFIHKASAGMPEVAQVVVQAFSDCTNSTVAKHGVSWLEASHLCLGEVRVGNSSVGQPIMPFSRFEAGHGFSAASSYSHETNNPGLAPGTGSLSPLCPGDPNQDCLSAWGILFNQAYEDVQDHSYTGKVAGAGGNNRQAIGTMMRSARRLVGDVLIRFVAEGSTATGGGARGRGNRRVVVQRTLPMVNGEVVIQNDLAGPSWYLKNFSRQVYSAIFSILHLQCIHQNELSRLTQSSGSSGNYHPYMWLDPTSESDVWERQQVWLDASGAVTCSGAPWNSGSGCSGSAVSVHRMLIAASGPEMPFEPIVAKHLFQLFAVNEADLEWQPGSSGVLIKQIDCSKLNLGTSSYAIDKLMSGNLIRKEIPRFPRIVFTYALRVATAKLWELYEQLQSVVHQVSAGAFSSIAKKHLDDMIQAQLRSSLFDGKKDNLDRYHALTQALREDFNSQVGSLGDLKVSIDKHAGRGRNGVLDPNSSE